MLASSAQRGRIWGMHSFGEMRARKALGIIALVVLLTVLVPVGLYLAANYYFGDDAASSSSASKPGENSNLPAKVAIAQPEQTGAAQVVAAATTNLAGGPPAARPTMDLLAIDQNGRQPISGLIVEVTGPGGWSGRTDAGGHAHVPLPADKHPWNFNVRLRGRGFVAQRLIWTTNVAFLNDGIFPATLTVAMEHGVRIAGKLIDDAGRPIAGDTVGFTFLRKFANPHEQIAWIVGNARLNVIRSDVNGNWSFEGAPSNCDRIVIEVLDSHREKVLRKLEPFSPVSRLYDGTAVITVPQGSNAGAAGGAGHL